MVELPGLENHGRRKPHASSNLALTAQVEFMILISFFFSTLILFMLLAVLIGAPLVPSKQKTTERMVGLLNLKPGQCLYDLGSGDGRVLIAAAKKRISGIGIEINPYAIIWSYIRALLTGQLTRIRVKWGSYWQISIAKADGVVVYAMPGFMPKMAEKLKKELRRGTLVVSNSFQIPSLRLVKQETVGKDRVFVYRI